VPSRPLVSLHYPKSAGEFSAWFRTDGDCLDYLTWLRWPEGFHCPACGQAGGWQLGVSCARAAGSGLGDRRHHLRPDADAVDSLVLCLWTHSVRCGESDAGANPSRSRPPTP
jgi:hypothetical protein